MRIVRQSSDSTLNMSRDQPESQFAAWWTHDTRSFAVLASKRKKAIHRIRITAVTSAMMRMIVAAGFPP